MPMEEVSIDPDAMAAVGGLDLSVCEWSAADVQMQSVRDSEGLQVM